QRITSKRAALAPLKRKLGPRRNSVVSDAMSTNQKRKSRSGRQKAIARPNGGNLPAAHVSKREINPISTSARQERGTGPERKAKRERAPAQEKYQRVQLMIPFKTLSAEGTGHRSEPLGKRNRPSGTDSKKVASVT